MLEPPILFTFGISQACGLLAAIFVVMASMREYKDLPAAAPQPTKNFSFHPALMSVGFCYLFGCAAVAFRVLRIIDKPQAKLVHVGIHSTALALTLTGFTFAVQATTSWGAEHFQSIHGLLGITTLVLFATQWAVSIPVFLWPKAPGNIRAPGIKIHVCLGVGVFLCAAITTFTGLSKHSGSSTTSANYYKTAAVFYLLYTLSIVFMVTYKKYKRPPDF